MIAKTSTRIATLLTIVLATVNVYADTFEELVSVGDAGRLHEAAGAYVKVFDEDRSPTGEQVFLLHGGYPPMVDPEPIADVWALAEGSWQHLSSDAPAMAGHALVSDSTGRAWALGAIGANGWLQPLDTLTAFEVHRVDGRLDIAVEQVGVPGPCPKACFGSTAIAVDGGRSIIYSTGACDLSSPLDPPRGQLWEYRIDANRWQRRADLPVHLSAHSVVTARDYLWVFGGAGSQGLSNEVYRYDLLTDTWDRIDIAGDGPAPRRDHRAAMAGSSMLIMGGLADTVFPETMDDVWQLDLGTLQWTEKTDLPTGLSGMTVAVVPAELSRAASVQVLLYGGVTDAWSFPLDLSDSTTVYTSDSPSPRQAEPRPGDLLATR